MQLEKMEVAVVQTVTLKMCKAPVRSPPPEYRHSVFYSLDDRQMMMIEPFLSSNQQHHCTEGVEMHSQLQNEFFQVVKTNTGEE